VRVIGVGNILLKDDGIGVRVAEYIKEKKLLPPQIDIVDGGTGGLQLMPMIKDEDCLIIIDAVKGGDRPGSIYRFTIDDIPVHIAQKTSLHELGLQEVFALMDLSEGKRPETVIIIGIEPGEVNYGMELSPELKAAVPKVAKIVVDEAVRQVRLGLDKPGWIA
jgi:hydrogenase maturation protease